MLLFVFWPLPDVSCVWPAVRDFYPLVADWEAAEAGEGFHRILGVLEKQHPEKDP